MQNDSENLPDFGDFDPFAGDEYPYTDEEIQQIMDEARPRETNVAGLILVLTLCGVSSVIGGLIVAVAVALTNAG